MNPVDLDTACKYGSGCARAPLVVLEWMGLRPYPAFSPPPLAELAGVGVHVPCPAFNEGLSLHRFAVGGGSGFEGLSARQARHNRLGYLGCLGDVEDSPCSFQQPSSVICAGRHTGHDGRLTGTHHDGCGERQVGEGEDTGIGLCDSGGHQRNRFLCRQVPSQIPAVDDLDLGVAAVGQRDELVLIGHDASLVMSTPALSNASVRRAVRISAISSSV